MILEIDNNRLKRGKGMEYIFADYLIKSDNIDEASMALVVGQSIGNPYKRSNYETAEILKRYYATVTSIEQSGDAYLVKTKFPVDLFTPGSFTHLVTVLMGGQMDIDIIKSCRLVRVDLPEKFSRSFPGPKYGIEGIRHLIKAYNRPLIGGIVKPKTGLSLSVLCEIVEKMVSGGIDFIKEDEILGEIQGACVKERIKAVASVLKGTNVIFAPAINVPINQYQDIAEVLNAYDNIYGYHLNVWAGLDAFQYLSALAKKVSFYQKSGDGVITRGRYSISFDVWCRFARLAGADMIHVGMLGGYLDEPQDVLQRRIDALQNPFYGHKGTIPSFSCGATPEHVPMLQKIFGNDIMISAGGSIHSHKDGSLAGVREFRQMADACATTMSEKGLEHAEV